MFWRGGVTVWRERYIFGGRVIGDRSAGKFAILNILRENTVRYR